MSEPLRDEILLDLGALPDPAPTSAPTAEADLASLRTLLRLALPLVLSMSGQTVMHLLDGLFLTWHSQAAMAAHGPSSLAAYLFMSLFLGATGFTSTFVAQYHGAGRPSRVGAAVWQALRLAWLSGGVVIVAAFALSGMFAWAGHEARLAHNEALFLRIACLGAPLTLTGSALSGFFSGRGDTRTLMAAQLAAQAVNAVIAAVLIFGAGPIPALGLAGAAWATLCAQGVLAATLCALFLQPSHRRRYGTWRHRAFDRELMARLLRFGLPNGLRFTVELVGWTAFLMIVGRLGEAQLTATNIVWRINSIAFFPLFGISSAVASLVGQAQGRRRPDLSERVAFNGLICAQSWMLGAAALFVLCPVPLVGLFERNYRVDPQAAQVVATCVTLLRFVAVYCLLDGLNLVYGGALQGAGDTRATFRIAAALYGLFLVSLGLLDHYGASLQAEWAAATVMVMALAVAYLLRWRSGRWHHLRVIEAGGPAEDSAGPARS